MERILLPHATCESELALSLMESITLEVGRGHTKCAKATTKLLATVVGKRAAKDALRAAKAHFATPPAADSRSATNLR